MTRGATSVLRQIGCAVLLMTLTATQSTAQTEPSRLSLTGAPQAVGNLIGSGQLTAAREIALAALRASPDNPRFMLSLARTETRLGNYASAIALVRKAYRTTNDPQTKFYAAQTVAQAHTSAGSLHARSGAPRPPRPAVRRVAAGAARAKSVVYVAFLWDYTDKQYQQRQR